MEVKGMSEGKVVGEVGVSRWRSFVCPLHPQTILDTLEQMDQQGVEPFQIMESVMGGQSVALIFGKTRLVLQ